MDRDLFLGARMDGSREKDAHLEGSIECRRWGRSRAVPATISTSRRAKQAILPLKSTDFYMGKAKELNATTTHELYEKAPSLELGKPFRVEDGSIRVHRQRKERGRKVVHSQIVCDALGDAKSRTRKLVTLSSGRTCAAGR